MYSSYGFVLIITTHKNVCIERRFIGTYLINVQNINIYSTI